MSSSRACAAVVLTVLAGSTSFAVGRLTADVNTLVQTDSKHDGGALNKTDKQRATPPPPLALLWPIPREVDTASCGSPVPLSPEFALVGPHIPRIERALERLHLPSGPPKVHLPSLKELRVTLSHSDDGGVPAKGVDEGYTLSVNEQHVDVTASTVFGALHALETFASMVSWSHACCYSVARNRSSVWCDALASVLAWHSLSLS
jgi:hypothetical protein